MTSVTEHAYGSLQSLTVRCVEKFTRNVSLTKMFQKLKKQRKRSFGTSVIPNM